MNTTTLYRFRDGRIETWTITGADPQSFPTDAAKHWGAGWRWVGAHLLDVYGHIYTIEEIYSNESRNKAVATMVGGGLFELHDPEDWEGCVYFHKESNIGFFKETEFKLTNDGTFDFPTVTIEDPELAEQMKLLNQESQKHINRALQATLESLAKAVRVELEEFIGRVPGIPIPICKDHTWINTGMQKTWCKHCDCEGEWTADYKGEKRS